MVRIQIARDRAMAEVVATALRKAPPGSTVLLLTGAQHASRDRGVPLHLQHDAGVAAADIHVVIFGEADGGLLCRRVASGRRHAAGGPLRGLAQAAGRATASVGRSALRLRACRRRRHAAAEGQARYKRLG